MLRVPLERSERVRLSVPVVEVERSRGDVGGIERSCEAVPSLLASLHGTT